MVDTVIRHWVTVAAPTEAGMEGIGETIQKLAAFFYTYYGLVALPWSDRLQIAFNVFTYLFNQVGLLTNV